MDCEAFHLDLPDLIYGELGGERKLAGDAHLAACASCKELVSDLQTVRTAQKSHAPSPLLTAQIKLAARDELLERSHAPVTGWGGSLHMATVGVLAACVCLAGFGLGIAYQRGRPAPDPLPTARTETPPPPSRFVSQPNDPGTIEISNPGSPNFRPGQRDPVAWQRSMESAARAHLDRKEWTQAREFFLAAVEAAPQGPRAAHALAGAAEALLGAGDRKAAEAEVEALRRKIMAGALKGDAELLQRLAELGEGD